MNYGKEHKLSVAADQRLKYRNFIPGICQRPLGANIFLFWLQLFLAKFSPQIAADSRAKN